MELRKIRKTAIDRLLKSGDQNILESLLRDLVRYLLESKHVDPVLLKHIAFYRLDKSPSDARSLINSLKRGLTPQDIDSILGVIRPIKIPEETLLEALTTIRKVIGDNKYRTWRATVRLLASYILSHPDSSLISANDVVDAAAYVGDPEAYWAALRVERGDTESLLSQVVYPGSLHRLPIEKIIYGAILRKFYEISARMKETYLNVMIDEKCVDKAVDKFGREYSAAGRTPYTAAYYDRLRVLSRISSNNFLSYGFPMAALELEKLFVDVLRHESSNAFREKFKDVKRILAVASAHNVVLTTDEILPQAFVMPWEDWLIGLRYRGREYGRFITRLLSFLVPELKDFYFIADDFKNTLFGINSLYPEEVYVGRYMHVGVEAYIFGREEMIKTKNRIIKKTFTNLVEDFVDYDDVLTMAKAFSRSVSILEGRSFIWGLAPEKVRKHESSSLYQQTITVLEFIDDRIVRLFAFMRMFRSVWEGIMMRTLIQDEKTPWLSIWKTIVRDLQDMVPIISATIYTLAQTDNNIIRLIAFSFSLGLIDALMAIRRIASLRKFTADVSESFYEYYENVGKIVEEVIPLAEHARENMMMFKFVKYPRDNDQTIFILSIRRYQIIEAIKRAAAYFYFYGLYDEVDKYASFIDERTLTAMEPRILRYDPDVIAITLPVFGGKKRFKLRVGTPAAHPNRRRLRSRSRLFPIEYRVLDVQSNVSA